MGCNNHSNQALTSTSVQLNSVKMIERWIASTYNVHIESLRFIFDQVRIPSNTFIMNATWQHDGYRY